MQTAILISVLLISIVLHEVAHAWQARREGDTTAEREGRITLNPIPHLDMMGSVILPAILVLSSSGFIFGWAKPVPVQPGNFRDPVWGDIRVSLAGIVVNLALVVVFTLAAAALVIVFGAPTGAVDTLFRLCRWGIYINLILAFFNLIPLPPLDGSHVLMHALPRSLRPAYRKLGQVGLLLVFALFIFLPGAFSVLLWPVDFFAGHADSFIRLWL